MLRRLVLGAFCCVIATVVLLVGVVVRSVTGLSFDPHGYAMYFGIVAAAVLGLVGQILWALHRWLR